MRYEEFIAVPTEVHICHPSRLIRMAGAAFLSASLVAGCSDANPSRQFSAERPAELPSSVGESNMPATAATVETTVPPVERISEPGEVIARLVIPRMCDLKAEVVQFAPGENRRVGTDSGIDQLIREEIPQPDCPEALQHAERQRQQNPKYATRGERVNANYPTYADLNGNERKDPGEQSDTANMFVPRWGQWPGTPEIGQRGNVVWFAHRTTMAATGAVIDMLLPGDMITVQSKGRTFNYKVTQLESIPTRNPEEEVAAIESVLHPPDHESKYMLTGFACEPQRDIAYRIVFRAELQR